VHRGNAPVPRVAVAGATNGDCGKTTANPNTYNVYNRGYPRFSELHMGDYTEGIGNAIRQGFCTVAPAAAVGALVFGGVATLGVASTVAAVAAGAVGLHAYNRYCNQPLPAAGRPQPPFQGGQCSVVYNVSGRANYSGTAIPAGIALGPTPVNGPVRGMVSENLPPNTTQVYVLGLVDAGHPDGRYGIATLNTSFGGGNDFQNAVVTSVVRQDGQPDNCGSLPALPPALPPGGNTVNSPVTYTTNNNVTVTIPMVIAFGYASFSFDGTVEIPLTLNFTANPELNLSGTLNLNTGDTNFYPDPGAPTDGCDNSPNDFIPDPSIPNYPPTLPGVDPDPPALPNKPERRKILRGVVVTVSNQGDESGFISQDQNPDIWFPDLGFVQFAVQVGGRIAWLRHEKINSLRHLVQCDWPSGAVEVRGTPRSGVTWTLTPVYTTQSFLPQYPPE
jgi:hypothetical protein